MWNEYNRVVAEGDHPSLKEVLAKEIDVNLPTPTVVVKFPQLDVTSLDRKQRSEYDLPEDLNFKVKPTWRTLKLRLLYTYGKSRL